MSVQLDNSGNRPLQVPGFGDIPLMFEIPCQDRFTHGIEEWCQLPGVTLREFAMTAAMDWITDQDEWYQGIFDAARLAILRTNIMAKFPLVSDQAWSWCLIELQDKAKFFHEKGFIEVLDTGSVVCKSDVLLPATLADELRAALEPLQAVKTPGNDLVDPCLYPLVYGATKVLSECGSTTINHDDLIAGLYPPDLTLTCAPQPSDLNTSRELFEAHLQEFGMDDVGKLRETVFKEDDSSLFYWSPRFQALPCEVSLALDGVSIQSYVNNLHPSFKNVYSCLEAVIAASIEPWNQCVLTGGQNWRREEPADTSESCINSWNQTQRGRKPLRIITFGVEWADGLPSWAIAFDESIKHQLKEFQSNTGWAAVYLSRPPLYMSASRSAYLDAVLQLDPIPNPSQETFEKAEAYLDYSEEMSPLTQPWKSDVYWHLRRKASAQIRWLHPEPGTAISYNNWRDGRNVDKAIIEMDDRTEGLSRMPTPAGPTHSSYKLCIQDQFRDQGLQVVVNIGSIDLDPASRVQHQQQWHLKGLLNEHIVATSLYVYEESNASAGLSFRQETPMAGAIYRDDARRAPSWVRERSADGTDAFRSILGDDQHGICGVFGLPEEAMNPWEAMNFLPMHETGRIKLHQGRLVAFPNVLESRMDVELVDKSLSGQLRYVMIDLVDPHYRICSTANVPPQQPHWRNVDLLAAAEDVHRVEASSVRKLLEVQEVMAGHRLEMLKESQWLNMARYARMETLGWADNL